jgi:TPR repeat protein
MKASVMKRVGMANRSLDCFVVITLCCQLQFLALAQEKKESYEKNPTYLKYHEQAEKGDVGAQENLGWFFEQVGIETKAVEWYKKAAGQNSSLATFQLAYIYSSVDLELTEKARGESSESPQQNELANQQGDLAKGTGQTQDQAQEAEAPQDAQDALGEAKKQMNEAQQQLNKPSADGARKPQEEAIKKLQEARKSVDDKIKELAQRLGQPHGPSPEDLQRALEAAQKAQDSIAEALAEEPDESIDQYLAAAGVDYLPALYELGNIYKKGRIGKQDPVKAESCYIRYVMGPAKERETELTTKAATWLAESYSEGADKIKKDLVKAATYYNLALDEVPAIEVEKREGLAGKIDLLELSEQKQKQAKENAKDSKWRDKEKKRAEKVQLD